MTTATYMITARASRVFALLLTLVAVFRLSLLDRGATSIVDETLYFTSVMALQAVRDGDVHGALAHIAAAKGRQGAAIVALPLAALQAVPSAFGVAASNPRSLLIPAVFNVIVSLVTLYLFFRISMILCGDERAALAATVVYALLVNTNLYLRHLLPYDLALCAGVYAIWLSLTRPRTLRLAAATGLLAGAVVTFYVGYYLLAVALGVAIVGQAGAGGWRRMVWFGAVFAAAAAVAIGVVELVCRAGGVSYVASSRALSRTITHGAFEEGWTFLPTYLIDVERLSGIALLVGTAAALWRAAVRLRRRALAPIDWLLLSALAAWVWQAADSAVWQNRVLYGRLMHPWLFVMSLALADRLAAIDRVMLRRVACAIVAAGAVISWVPWARAYYRLAYPPNVLYSLGIDTIRMPPERMLCELTTGSWYHPPGPLDRATGYPYTGDTNYLLINFCWGPPSGRLAIDQEIAAQTPLFDGPHFLTFRGYWFEGFNPSARDEMARHEYRVRAYRLTPAGTGQ